MACSKVMRASGVCPATDTASKQNSSDTLGLLRLARSWAMSGLQASGQSGRRRRATPAMARHTNPQHGQRATGRLGNAHHLIVELLARAGCKRPEQIDHRVAVPVPGPGEAAVERVQRTIGIQADQPSGEGKVRVTETPREVLVVERVGSGLLAQVVSWVVAFRFSGRVEFLRPNTRDDCPPIANPVVRIHPAVDRCKAA